MALQKDIEKIEKLLEEKETISVISAVGENGNPISQVGRKLTMWGKAENEPEQIRVMTPGNYLPIIIADKKGFFKEAFGEERKRWKLRLPILVRRIMETMTSGGVEFAALGDMPVVQAKANGLDVKVISSLFRSTSGYQLIAAKDSGISNISGYQGKTGRGDVGKHQS